MQVVLSLLVLSVIYMENITFQIVGLLTDDPLGIVALSVLLSVMSGPDDLTELSTH